MNPAYHRPDNVRTPPHRLLDWIALEDPVDQARRQSRLPAGTTLWPVTAAMRSKSAS
jgi:hypothetical protein